VAGGSDIYDRHGGGGFRGLTPVSRSGSRAATAAGDRSPPGDSARRRGERAARRVLPVRGAPPSTSPRHPPASGPGPALRVAPGPGALERRQQGDGAGDWASAPREAPARSPARRQQPRSPPRLGPIAQSLRVCTSSSPPPPSLAQKGGRTSLPAAGWFILRPRLTLIHTASRSRQIFRSGAGNRRAASQSVELHLPVRLPLGIGEWRGAGRVGNVASPCQRKKTLSLGGSTPPRVAPNRDGLGLRFCLGRSRRRKRTREPGAPADRHPRRARGPCPTSLPRKSPRGVFRREGTVNSSRGRRQGPSTGKERTEFQERVTRN